MRVITAAAALVPVLLLAGCGSPGGSEEATGQAIPSSDGLAPKGRTIPGLEVQRVIDGDTIKVDIDGESLTVRMVGIDTPETVKPDSPVECFGPEASDFATGLLTDATVTLEIDESQGATDQYGRALAYVWRELPDGSLSMFNLEAVAGGYAEARQYGPDAYAWKAEFDAAEDAARSAGAGQWGACRG
jgi:micrococcal nuclease